MSSLVTHAPCYDWKFSLFYIYIIRFCVLSFFFGNGKEYTPSVVEAQYLAPLVDYLAMAS